MLPSHKICPICETSLSTNKNIRKYCEPIDKTISFNIEYCGCHSFDSHFTQITSLYGELYLEKVILKLENYNATIINNFIKKNSIIQYSIDNEIKESINSGALIKFDFPSLKKVYDKVQTLALFL
jgi:hypothetical protein